MLACKQPHKKKYLYALQIWSKLTHKIQKTKITKTTKTQTCFLELKLSLFSLVKSKLYSTSQYFIYLSFKRPMCAPVGFYFKFVLKKKKKHSAQTVNELGFIWKEKKWPKEANIIQLFHFKAGVLKLFCFRNWNLAEDFTSFPTLWENVFLWIALSITLIAIESGTWNIQIYFLWLTLTS